MFTRGYLLEVPLWLHVKALSRVTVDPSRSVVDSNTMNQLSIGCLPQLEQPNKGFKSHNPFRASQY